MPVTIGDVARRAGVGRGTVSRVPNNRPYVDPATRARFVASSDTEAMGVLEAATALGLEVPGDLSVVGYDDVGAAEHVGLTTVR